MTPVVLGLPGSEPLANRIGACAALDVGSVLLHRFPDAEVRVRLTRQVSEKAVILTTPFDRPDDKILPLVFAAATARDLGAVSVGLVAPYLPYMRQDRRFDPHEGVSARYFARLLSRAVDWLVTVDPHLHRITCLGDLYSIPARAVSSVPLLAEWVSTHVERPIIIGPDEESAQWVKNLAGRVEAPYALLNKRRSGDQSVSIRLPDLSESVGRQPVLVDDIIASGATMLEAIRLLRHAGWPSPVCLAVHGIFAGDTYRTLQQAGVAKIVTCNTIAHATNEIDVSRSIAAAVTECLDAGSLSHGVLEEIR